MTDINDNYIDMKTLKNNNKTIVLKERISNLSLKKLFLLSPFKQGDIVVDKKGKRLLVSKIHNKNVYVNGVPYREGSCQVTLQDENLKIYTFEV